MWVFVSLLLLLIVGVAGVLFTNTALVWALKAVPNVQVRGVQGNIAHGFVLDAVTWQGKNADGATQQVVLKQFQFAPDWLSLKTRTLQVDTLSVAEIEVTWPSEANAPPLVLPDAVDVPLNLDVRQLRVWVLVVNGVALQNIQGQALVDNRQLVVKHLRWSQADSLLDSNLTMTLQRPYALLGRVDMKRDQSPLNLSGQVDLKGSLEQLHLQMEAKATQTESKKPGVFVAQTLNVDTVLTPFAPEVVERLSVQAEGFNPKDWVNTAPKASLSIQAQVQPAEQFSKATGHIQLRNAMPMSIQQGGLPLRSAKLGLTARLDKQQLSNVDIEVESLDLARGSEAAGEVQARLSWKAAKVEKAPVSFVQRLMDGQTHVHLALHQLKPAVFGPAPKAMVLNGEVQAQLQGAVVEVTRVQLEDRGARLEGRGQGQLDQRQEVQAQLEFSHVNPAAYANKPSPSVQGDLNGQAKVSGSLKNREGLIELGFDHSSVGKTPFILDARIQGNPKRVNALNIHADVLGNTVHAQGAYGQPGDALNVQVNMPKLAALGALLQQQWAGTLALNATLTGQGWGMSGQGDAKVRDLKLGQTLAVQTLDAQFHVGNQADAPWEALVQAKGMGTPGTNAGDWVDVLNARLQGKRQQHTLSVDVQSELSPFSRRRALKGAFRVTGGLSVPHDKVDNWSWRGQIDALKVDGMWAPMRSLTLLAPASLQLAPHRVEVGAFELIGEDNTRIQNQTLRMAGADVQIQGKAPAFPMPRLSTLLKTPVSLEPKDLVLGADWNYTASAKGLDGRLNVFHVSGGLQVLEDLQLEVPLQDFHAKLAFTRQSAQVDMKVDAKDFGNVVANMTLPIAQNPNTRAWGLASHLPMTGSMGASFSKLNWVGPMINGGLRTQGSGQVSVAIGGTLNAPDVQGRVFGMGLEVFQLDQGVRLEEGQVVVDFTTDQAKIQTFDFTVRNRLSPRKHQDELLPLIKGEGKLSARGEWNLSGLNGALLVNMDRAVIVQRPDRWVLASSNLDIQQPAEPGKPLKVRGQVDVHGAYIETPEKGAPTLGDDVVIKGKTQGAAGTALPVDVQMQAKLGPLFFLNAEGLRTRLEGGMRLVMQDGGSSQSGEQTRKAGRRLLGTGTIQMVDGTYRAYGQDLTIEQGVINFQGPLDNPGLHVRAVRKGGAVEAGVEVTGSAMRPKVTLVSDPAVPDSEKLSWMIIGRSSNASDRDQTLLLTAAAALLGNDDEGPARKVAKRLGIDDVGFTTGSLTAADSRAVGSKVALAPGADVSANATGDDDPLLRQRIITLGKRLSEKLQVSFDQSVTTAASVLKLNYQYSRQLSVIARTGADNAIDVLYQLSFD